MYVIAGLGNPGKNYEKTRHNMGFQALDRIADKTGIPVKRLKHKALIGDGRISGERVLLVKPQTYMNNSGQSLGEILRYYDIEPEAKTGRISSLTRSVRKMPICWRML